jgi:hypothetical protein
VGTNLRAQKPGKSAALLAAGAWTGDKSKSKHKLREQKTERQEGIGTETPSARTEEKASGETGAELVQVTEPTVADSASRRT